MWKRFSGPLWVMKDDSLKRPHRKSHCIWGSENKIFNPQSYGLLVKRSKILYKLNNYDMRRGADSLFCIPGCCGIQREVRMGLSVLGRVHLDRTFTCDLILYHNLCKVSIFLWKQEHSPYGYTCIIPIHTTIKGGQA